MLDEWSGRDRIPVLDRIHTRRHNVLDEWSGRDRIPVLDRIHTRRYNMLDVGSSSRW